MSAARAARAHEAGDRHQGGAARRKAPVPRPPTPARWPAPTRSTTRRSAAPACCACSTWTSCSTRSRPRHGTQAARRPAGHPDQRRRRSGVLATDALIDRGGRLAELSQTTLARLDAVLPATWSRGNPVDIIGDAPANALRRRAAGAGRGRRRRRGAGDATARPASRPVPRRPGRWCDAASGRTAAPGAHQLGRRQTAAHGAAAVRRARIPTYDTPGAGGAGLHAHGATTAAARRC